MEGSPYATLKYMLSTVSLKALGKDIRLILAKNLDRKQTVVSEKGFARDYRGLGELIGLPYTDIKRIEGFEDRTIRILKGWEMLPDATLDKLISLLEDMDRHDLIEEILPLLRGMFEKYIQHQKSLLETIQSYEGGSVYDAYLCFADEDSNLAQEFLQRLESPRVGLKLFITGRNTPTWHTNLNKADCDKNYIIKTQCRHVLILLTPNFTKSPALEFLSIFASSLTDEEKETILVPVILVPCQSPPILDTKYLIDFSKEYAQALRDLMWDSLIISLLPLEYSITMPCAAMEHDVYCSVTYSSTVYMIKSIDSSENDDSGEEDGLNLMMCQKHFLSGHSSSKKFHYFLFRYHST